MSFDFLLICHDVDRGDIKEGLPYSKLIDSLYEEFMGKGYNCLQVAFPDAQLVDEKAWGKPLRFENFFYNEFFFNKILIKLTTILTRIFKIEIKINRIFIPKNHTNNWLKIFQIIQPKVIFSIGASSEMCCAAKRIRIPVVEVLHGIGYRRIEWGWEQKNYYELPDFILCLDSISKKSFMPLEYKGIIIKEIPHPWYKRFSMKIPPHNIDSTWLNCPCSIPVVNKVVLVSLQWGYAGDHGEHTEFSNIVPNGLLPDELVRAIEDTKQEVFYCIRRHPVQLRRKKYKKQVAFLDKFVSTHLNCEYIDSSKSTLVSLLQKVDGHITLSSMVSYEAAMMGVKTLLLCPTVLAGGKNESLFEDLVSKGYASKILPEKNKIINWIDHLYKISPLSLTDAKERDWEVLISGLIRRNEFIQQSD